MYFCGAKITKIEKRYTLKVEKNTFYIENSLSTPIGWFDSVVDVSRF